MGVTMNRPRVTCPRCRRECAARGWDPIDAAVPVRHKDENREWCSGKPKTRNELVIDLVGAMTDERDALREYSDELVRHSEEVMRIIHKHTAAQEVGTELIRQITETYHVEIAERKAEMAATAQS